jgi:hypothetical protein
MDLLASIGFAAAALLSFIFAAGLFWIYIGHPRDWWEERDLGRVTWRFRAPYRPDRNPFGALQAAMPREAAPRRRSLS